MKGKGLYAVFGVIAAAVVVGIIYFGTGANQQASIGALKTATAPVEGGVGPITTNPNDPGWIKLCRDGKPHLQLLSPNGNESYVAGQQATITWRSCNLAATSRVRIDLNLADAPGAVAIALTQTANDGSETVTLPTSASWPNMVYGKHFKTTVWVTNFSGTPVPTDSSNRMFTINAPAAGAVVTELVSSTNNAAYNNNGTLNNVTVTMNIRVTAQGTDMYIPRSVKTGTSISDQIVPPAGFIVVPVNASLSFDDRASVISTVTMLSGGIIDGSGRFKISKGQTANLQITSVVTAPAGSGMKAIQLNAVGASETNLGNLIIYPTLPVSAYRSQFTPAF